MDSMHQEGVPHCMKDGVEVLLTTQVMRWFGTTIEDDPHGGTRFPEMPEQAKHLIWPGTRKGTAGEKD